MDLIAELIKAIVAAFEDSKERKRLQTQGEPAPSGAAPSSPRGQREEAAELAMAQRRLADKAEILRQQREAQVAAHVAAQAETQAARQRAGAAARSVPADAPRAAPRVPTGPQRLARLLRQPGTARELIVLSELLGPPKCLRRGQR